MKLNFTGISVPEVKTFSLQPFLVIKLSIIILLLTTCLQLTAHPYPPNITYSKHNISPEKVFKVIRKHTVFEFLNNDLTTKAKRVEHTPVEKVQREIFRDKLLMYRSIRNTMMAKKITAFQNSIGTVQLTEIKIQGTVVDSATGSPLIGVTVQVKGSTTATITDMKGQFSLTVPDDAVLEVSYVEYDTKEIPVNGRSVITISLASSTTGLNQVVVVGYGTQKKSDLTGSITSVSGNQIKDLPARSVAEALQGQASGVTVTKGQGGPGAGADIIIRGAGDINGLPPLYIVDGVRMGTGNNFNIQDIQSIEILKDAASSSIYGAQAAGGVILITTKRGANGGKMAINLNANYGIHQPVNLIHLLNTSDFMKAKAAYGNDISSWGDPTKLPDTDWIGELFGNGKQQSYNLSISGSSEKANYFVSGNYQRDDGIRLDNWFQRYTLRINSDYHINKKLKVGETLYAWKTMTNPTTNGQIPFRSVPTMAVRDSSNPMGGWGKQPPGSYFEGPNPVANELIRHDNNEGYALESSVYADLEIIKNLNFRATFAASVGGGDNSQFYEAFNYGSLAQTNGIFSKNFNKYENLTANYVLTYGSTFGLHSLKVMAGYEALKNSSTDLSGSAIGFPVQVAQSFAVSTQPSTSRTATGGLINSRVLSQFGRLNYGYDNKYLLTASIRRDASTNFGPENRWGIFPSFSAAWRINKESFMKNTMPVISNLKIRGGYGVLGTDNIGQYLYESAYNSQSVTFLGNQVAQGWGIFKFPNPNIKWEEVHQTDVGLDLGLWHDKLTVTADWYSRQTIGMLYYINTAPSAGVGTYNGAPAQVPTNIGQISNKGFELAASYRAHAGEFNFTIGGNASFNKNKVLELGKDSVPIISGFPGEYWNGSVSKTQQGFPMSQFYGFVVEGIYKSDEDVAKRNVFQSVETGAGDLIYKDLNNDGVINNDDKTYIGNPWPKMVYALNFNASWKNFDLTLFFTGVSGVDIFDGTLSNTQNFIGDYNTTSEIFGTSFFDGNGLTDKPRVGYYQTTANGQKTYIRDPNGNYKNVSSYFVRDGSYLKLKNTQIGYQLPESLLSRVNISNARLYLMAQDLFTITKYPGMDPELAGSVTSRGIDNYQIYPHSRLFAIGIDVGF